MKKAGLHIGNRIGNVLSEIRSGIRNVIFPPAKPVLVGDPYVTDAEPNFVVFAFDMVLDGLSVPANTVFTISGKTNTGDPVISGATIKQQVTERYYWGDTGTAAYTKPGSNPIKSTLGGEADTFGATEITNNVALDARAAALIASYGTVPTNATKALLNKTIVDLKAKTFNKITTLVLPMHTSNDSLLNIIAATYTGQLVNAPAFTAGLGWYLNGTTQYINPVYNPRADGGLFTLNSGSFAIIFNGITEETGITQISGSRSTSADGGANNRILLARPRIPGENYAVAVNGAAIAENSTERTSGIYFITRTTNLIVRYFVNKVLKASSTNSASTKIPNQVPLVGAEISEIIAIAFFHKGSVGGYMIGAGMTDQEIADTTDIIQYFRDNIQATL